MYIDHTIDILIAHKKFNITISPKKEKLNKKSMLYYQFLFNITILTSDYMAKNSVV